MKALMAAAVGALVAAGALAQPGAGEVAVLIDTDVPAEVAADSARLRTAVLTGVERDGRPTYFQLNAKGTERRDLSSLVAKSPAAPQTYGGVSISYREAMEMLRRNESVRDAVIRRECAVRPASDCGGLVGAAAQLVVKDTEADSSRRLQHLVRFASAGPSRSLVLVSAGWPYRDQGSARLDEAIRNLRAAGTRIVIVRIPAALPYKGLADDLTETLAARMAAPFFAIGGDADVPAAHRAIVERIDASVPSTRVETVTPPASARPAAGGGPAAAPAKPADALLSRAFIYVTQFERTFAAVVWRERYTQEARTRRTFSTSGGSFSALAARRELDSELLLVWLPAEPTWITVRDVVRVDGTPRPEADRARLAELLTGPSVSVRRLRELAAENGRFNVGRIHRTFNEPTLALLFLDDHYRHRFAFEARGEQRIDGLRTGRYDFVERATPTVIRDRDRDVAARGALWIDVATGQVRQTMLMLANTGGGVDGRMTVKYGPHLRFDVLVPLQMRETYASDSGEEVVGTARYTDFRRFETSGRIIVPE